MAAAGWGPQEAGGTAADTHRKADVDGERSVRQLQIGVQLASLKLPFRQALDVAQRLGADAVELDARGDLRPSSITGTGLRQLRRLLEDRGLRVSAVGFMTRRGYHVAEDLEQRISATKKALDFAFALGTQVVVNQVGFIAADRSLPEWATLLEALTDIGRHGQKCGARLAARTGAEEATTLRTLVDVLPEGFLPIDLDPAGLVLNGYSPLDAVTVLGPDVVHVHARDGVRDAGRGQSMEVPLGRGAADFPALLASLESFNYRGFLTVERQSTAQVIEEIADAIRYLRAIQHCD